ncbi:PIF-1 [Macrobrachium rosenbergii nudivirus]|nr:PIF-1 [Macrobrachium rosenbergii nudivirus]
MEKPLITFIILCGVFIILTIILKVFMVNFNKKFETKIKDNTTDLSDIIKFSYDIYFNPPPDDFVIENPDACSATDRKTCSMKDPFSCSSCKSLLATCKHFAEDIKYVDSEGNTSIIPKNTTEDEGYCITQENISQMCNPYHGDLILIQPDKKSPNVRLFCDCKNPGYIGKTNINGACDEVFICNGKIDNINQPLTDIRCVCGDDYESILVNDVPSCVFSTVENFKGYDKDDFYGDIPLVSVDNFNSDIRNYYPGKKLPDPCKYCMLTGDYIPNGKMVESDDGWQCVTSKIDKGGLPIRRSLSQRLLAGTKGPDAVINLKVQNILIQGYQQNTEFEQIVVTFKVKDNKKILAYIDKDMLEISPRQQGFLNLTNHELVFPGSFGSGRFISFPGTYCTGIEIPFTWVDDFQYNCFFSNEIPHNRNPANHNSYYTNYGNNTFFDTAPNCPPKHHSFMTGGAFSQWKMYEGFNSAHSKRISNGLIKYEISQKFKNTSDVRYVLSQFSAPGGYANHYGAPNRNDFLKWYKYLIPREDE